MFTIIIIVIRRIPPQHSADWPDRKSSDESRSRVGAFSWCWTISCVILLFSVCVCDVVAFRVSMFSCFQIVLVMVMSCHVWFIQLVSNHGQTGSNIAEITDVLLEPSGEHDLCTVPLSSGRSLSTHSGASTTHVSGRCLTNTWLRTNGVNTNGVAAEVMNLTAWGKTYALALLGIKKQINGSNYPKNPCQKT